ncbi:MAG: hypothetical protein AAB317_04880 [Nitrospirota bacterium]
MTAHFTLSHLLSEIEIIYQKIFDLTAESEKPDTNIDLQVEMEAVRAQYLEKADLVYEEISRLISIEAEEEEPIDVAGFLSQKRKLIQLAHKIRAMDQKRIVWIEKEQSEISQALDDFRIGTQAVNQYQKTMAIPF